MAEKQAESANPAQQNFLKALSNYSECIRPFLRTAQDRYVASYYMVEDQPFDFNKYCVVERKLAVEAKSKIEATMTQ